MIIVSGKIYVRSGTQQQFVDSSLAAVAQARKTGGCHDFVVAADPLEPDRVNVYEEWETEESLLSFRNDGPDLTLSEFIVKIKVSQCVVE